MDINGVLQVERQGEAFLFRIKQGALSIEAIVTAHQARDIAWAILYKIREPEGGFVELDLPLVDDAGNW